MKKVVVIGANAFQYPLIKKAKDRGYETHVFAWENGAVGKEIADYFYPISIVEKEEILEKCKELKPDAVCTIASDLASKTVCYLAEKLGLCGNSMHCSDIATDKHLMRNAFEANGVPSPKSVLVTKSTDLSGMQFDYPVIVKPADRSGSRGITKVEKKGDLASAVARAMADSFEKHVLIEEFAEGQEYSVEFISYQGTHHYLTTTKKFTTGAPGFVETGHVQPAGLDKETEARVVHEVKNALNALEITNGASHSELKIDDKGNIKFIEIGARMGGDCIGSDLVGLSTGFDFVGGVLDVALGEEPNIQKRENSRFAFIRFLFSGEDERILKKLKEEHPEWLVREYRETDEAPESVVVTNSADRVGFFIASAENAELLTYLENI